MTNTNNIFKKTTMTKNSKVHIKDYIILMLMKSNI